MKRCPKCASSFPLTVRFCEFDGAQLVADYLNSDPDWLAPPEKESPHAEPSIGDALVTVDYSDSEPNLPGTHDEQPPQTEPSAARYQPPLYPRTAAPQQNSQIFSIIILACVVAAVAVGLLLFLVYQRMTYEAPMDNSNESSRVSVTQQQVPQPPSRLSPSVSESPSPEPSPSPRATPSPAAQFESPRIALSSTEVSTGGNEKLRRGPVTIQLTNGTSVEADEAW